MNRLIELNNKGRLDIQPEALAIPAYATIWNRDKSTNKEVAIKELTLVYFARNMGKYNPYKEWQGDERVAKIKEHLHITGKLDKAIMEAIKIYEEQNYTFATDYLLAQLEGANKVKDFIRSVDLTECDEYGKPKYKPIDITKVQKESAAIVKVLKELLKIEQEGLEKQDSKIRGGGRQGMFETSDEEITI